MGTQFSNSEKAPKFEENDPPPVIRRLAIRACPVDVGVVNTTDDNCEQQIQSVALRLQQLTMHTGGETTVVLVARASFRR